LINTNNPGKLSTRHRFRFVEKGYGRRAVQLHPGYILAHNGLSSPGRYQNFVYKPPFYTRMNEHRFLFFSVLFKTDGLKIPQYRH